MTVRELLKELRALHNASDPEQAHNAADRLLLEYIDNPTVAAAFNMVPRWYA